MSRTKNTDFHIKSCEKIRDVTFILMYERLVSAVISSSIKRFISVHLTNDVCCTFELKDQKSSRASYTRWKSTDYIYKTASTYTTIYDTYKKIIRGVIYFDRFILLWYYILNFLNFYRTHKIEFLWIYHNIDLYSFRICLIYFVYKYISLCTTEYTCDMFACSYTSISITYEDVLRIALYRQAYHKAEHSAWVERRARACLCFISLTLLRFRNF